MKVLYINLDKDQDRRSFMEKQLTDLGFEYERIPAVDGRTLAEEELAQVYDSRASIKYNKKDLTRGELGCALSHKKCHELALGHDYTLILEDDIELPDNFKQIVEDQIAINIKKKKWGYLQFDYPEVGLIFVKRWVESVLLYRQTHLVSKGVYKNFVYFVYSAIKFMYILPLSLFEHVRNELYKTLGSHRAVTFYRPLYFAGCYIVDGCGAQKLLDLEVRIVFAADRVQNQASLKNSLLIKSITPLCVSQKRQEFGSSILDLKTIQY